MHHHPAASFPNTILVQAGVHLTNSRPHVARVLVEPKADRIVNVIKERETTHSSDLSNHPNEPTSHASHAFHLTCLTVICGSNACVLRCADTRKKVCDTCGVCGMSRSAVGAWIPVGDTSGVGARVGIIDVLHRCSVSTDG